MKIISNFFQYFSVVKKKNTKLILSYLILTLLSFAEGFLSFKIFAKFIDILTTMTLDEIIIVYLLVLLITKYGIAIINEIIELQNVVFLNEVKEDFFALYSKINYYDLSKDYISEELELSRQLLKEDTFSRLSHSLIEQLSTLSSILGILTFLITQSIIVLLMSVAFIVVQFLFQRTNISNQLIKFEKERSIFRKERYFDYLLQEKKYLRDIKSYSREETILKEASQSNDEMLKMVDEYFVKNQLKIDIKIKVFQYCQLLISNLYILVVGFVFITPASEILVLLKMNYDIISKTRMFTYSMSESLVFLSLFNKHIKFHNSFECTPKTEVKFDQIVFEHVYFNYGKRPALSDINLTLNKHEKYALIGKNGSGKTTLSLLISGLIKPKQGVIKYYYQNKLVMTSEDVDKTPSTSVLFQDFKHFEASLIENIYQNQTGDIPDLINDLDESQKDYSLGQKQRISLSRALCKKASVLVIDEPSASLDRGKEKLIYSIMDQDLEFAFVVFITHKIDYINNDIKIILLSEGKINAIGTKPDLLERSKLFCELDY